MAYWVEIIVAEPVIEVSAPQGAAKDRAKPHPLDARNSGAGSLIQADRVERFDVGAIIELRRARRLMGRNLLHVLDCTTILQIGGDPGNPEGVTTGRVRLRKSGPFRSAGICADLRWDAV